MGPGPLPLAVAGQDWRGWWEGSKGQRTPGGQNLQPGPERPTCSPSDWGRLAQVLTSPTAGAGSGPAA